MGIRLPSSRKAHELAAGREEEEKKDCGMRKLRERWARNSKWAPLSAAASSVSTRTLGRATASEHDCLQRRTGGGLQATRGELVFAMPDESFQEEEFAGKKVGGQQCKPALKELDS